MLISVDMNMGMPTNEGFMGDYELSTVGKIFLAGVAAWLIGRPSHLKIRGTPDEVEALQNALMASRRFRDELNRPGATVQSVMDKLQLKNITAQEFERKLGVPWPL